MRKGRGIIASTEGRHFCWHRLADIVMLILNNVLNSQSGGYQASSYSICFLVISPNRSLGHTVAFGPVQRLFCPVLTLQDVLRHEMHQAAPLAGQILRAGVSSTSLRF